MATPGGTATPPGGSPSGQSLEEQQYAARPIKTTNIVPHLFAIPRRNLPGQVFQPSMILSGSFNCIKPAHQVIIWDSAWLVINPGSCLVIAAGGCLLIRSGGKFIVPSGARLAIEQGANVQSQGGAQVDCAPDSLFRATRHIGPNGLIRFRYSPVHQPISVPSNLSNAFPDGHGGQGNSEPIQQQSDEQIPQEPDGLLQEQPDSLTQQQSKAEPIQQRSDAAEIEHQQQSDESMQQDRNIPMPQQPDVLVQQHPDGLIEQQRDQLIQNQAEQQPEVIPSLEELCLAAASCPTQASEPSPFKETAVDAFMGASRRRALYEMRGEGFIQVHPKLGPTL